MKKITLLVTMIVLCIVFVCGCAAKPASQPAAEAPVPTAEQRTAAPEQETPAPSEEKTEESPAPLALPGEDMLGEWYGVDNPRVNMTVTRDGEEFSVVVRWSDSAFAYYDWRMTGTYEEMEDGRIVSDNCEKYYVEYTDETNFEEELLYDGGSAHITYVNGMLHWFDAEEDAGADCMFEKGR